MTFIRPRKSVSMSSLFTTYSTDASRRQISNTRLLVIAFQLRDSDTRFCLLRDSDTQLSNVDCLKT